MHHERHPVLVVAQPEGSDTPVKVALDVAPAQSLRDHEVREVRREVAGYGPRRWGRVVSLALLMALGGSVALGLGRTSRAAARRRRRIAGGAMIGAAALGAGFVRWQLARLFTEEPPYTVEVADGPFEIRRYAPHVVATTPVEGPFRGALDEGFRRLADYIFAKSNVRRDARTLAPSPAHETQKVPMTAPVFAAREGEHHVVSFVMPENENLETLPVPTDARVELHEVPTQRVAVLRFHGRYDADTIREKQEELFHLITHAGLTPIGEPEFAGYDAPWTLPLLRRVEVWIPIA